MMEFKKGDVCEYIEKKESDMYEKFTIVDADCGMVCIVSGHNSGKIWYASKHLIKKSFCWGRIFIGFLLFILLSCVLCNFADAKSNRFPSRGYVNALKNKSVNRTKESPFVKGVVTAGIITFGLATIGKQQKEKSRYAE